MTKTTTVPIDSILVEDRQRVDLGDIDELAYSIKTNGLIQPIVLNQENRLIAGGRRLTAIRQLGWTEVPVVYRETLNERQLTILELEENYRRKDMTWKEKVLSVYKVHCLQVQEAALEGDEWTIKMTGAMMGISRAHVGFMVSVARELQNEKSGIHACDNLWEAIRFLMRRKEDEAQAILAKSLFPTAPPEAPALRSMKLPPPPDGLPMVEPVPSYRSSEAVVPLSQMLFRTDCLAKLVEMENGSVNHIITDPPYAIDMLMLNQNNPHGDMVDVERIAETHQVGSNLELLKRFVPQAFRITDERGFLIMFCDPMRWQWLYDLTTSVGWKVQRWPFIWHKTHPCLNQAAQANMTKNFEFAMVCRKQKAVLKKPVTSSIFSCSGAGYISNPFAKPLELWSYLIEAVSIRGETILDPFMGEGSCTTTTISCHRKPIGIEIDEKHFNVAVDEVRKLYDIVLRKPTYT